MYGLNDGSGTTFESLRISFMSIRIELCNQRLPPADVTPSKRGRRSHTAFEAIFGRYHTLCYAYDGWVRDWRGLLFRFEPAKHHNKKRVIFIQ